MKPRILVTGATGNTGAEVIAALRQNEAVIVAGVRNPERARQKLGEGIEYVRFDFRQPETFEAAFQGIDKVFLVRPPEIADVKRYIEPAVRAAKVAGVRHIVFLSLLGVEKNPVVPHYKIEQVIRASGLDWTFLRAGFFMQNLSTTHRDEIKERSEIFVPAGKGKTSFIDVRDIAEIAAYALTSPGHEGQAYDLTGPEAVDYYQVARNFSRTLGRPVIYKNPSSLAFGWRKWQEKQPLMYTLVVTALYTTARLGRAGRVTPEAGHLLGREPRSLHQYIEDYKNAWL